MRVFRGETLADVYGEAVLAVLKEGERISPRGKPCREIRPISIVTRDPTHPRLNSTSVNYRFGMAEFMAMIAGWSDVGWLARFNKNVGQFSDDGVVFAGAYGGRVPQQLPHLIDQLRADPDTRQAVLQIWDWQRDLYPVKTKDRPCNTQVYFKIRQGALHAMVTRRSADMVWGVPYDTFVFSNLLVLLAGVLELNVGVLTEVIDSAHVYTNEAGFYDDLRVTQAIMTPREHGPLPTLWGFNSWEMAYAVFTNVRLHIQGMYKIDTEIERSVLELL